jgi:hypothetical protein
VQKQIKLVSLLLNEILKEKERQNDLSTNSFTVDADPVFGCWHRVEVGCVANVSENHTTSTGLK